MDAAAKRVHLVDAAKQLLHEQGFHRTTLADVAGRARVPLGNVYYYFKTKEALAEAVIAAHAEMLELRHAEWTARHRDPRERLRRVIRAPLDGADTIVRFGCPHGSLCQELEKLGDGAPLAKASTRLLKVYVDFATEQLRELGLSKRARPLATALIAQIQGAMLVAHTMRSRAVLAEQLGLVERWMESITSTRKPS
jgi:AcrR family transcriptional regulator